MTGFLKGLRALTLSEGCDRVEELTGTYPDEIEMLPLTINTLLHQAGSHHAVDPNDPNFVVRFSGIPVVVRYDLGFGWVILKLKGEEHLAVNLLPGEDIQSL